MRIQVVPTAADFDRAVAMDVTRQVIAKPDSCIALATGTTTIGPHAQIVELARQEGVDYSQAKTTNLDEYVGLAASDPKSCRYRIDEQLLDLINIDKANTYVPNGLREPIEAEIDTFRQTLARFGGVDLMIVSIGTNGHIAFNEPGTPFGSTIYLADLADNTLDAKAEFFGDRGAVPRRGLTMGIRDVMQGRRVLLIAKGASKAEIIRQALTGPVTEDVPASVLQLHPNLTVILDAAAAALLQDAP